MDISKLISVLVLEKNTKTFKIHKCVAETFINNPNNLPFINHIDSNKLNNYYQNLEWCTPLENARHARTHNLIDMNKVRSTNNSQAKFTEDEIHYIRQNYIPKDHEFGARALARKFNVHHSVIEGIVNYRTYQNVA